MSEASNLHDQAMEITDQAMRAQRRGQKEEAQRLFGEAYEKEAAGIDALEEHEHVEPWYTVLHRSAATLALDSNRPRDAERLVAKMLAGEPHPAIVDELRDVWERALSMRHFADKMNELTAGEMKMVLKGDEVGYGFVNSSEVLSRVGSSEKLVQRIVQRLAGEPYGRMRKAFSSYGLRMSVPEAGSFAVNLQLAIPPDGQESLNLAPEDVIGEFIDLMDLLNANALRAIEERLADTGYFSDFLKLGKAIMPDGVKVTQVGFATSGTGGARRSTVLIRPAYEVLAYGVLGRNVMPTLAMLDSEESVREIEGRLLYADALGSNMIKVQDDKGSTHTLFVSAKGMADTGRLWGSRVRAVGVYKGRDLVLEEIELL